MPYRSSRRHLQIGISHLGAHFTRWKDYYHFDERKIAEARRHLALLFWEKWAEQVESNGGLPTWHGFRSFILERKGKIVGLEALLERYDGACQRTTQSVQDYAATLTEIQRLIGPVPDDNERIRKLYDTVLPEVRAAAPHPQTHLGDFRAWVKMLAEVEIQIPCRYEMVGKRGELQLKRRRIR
ncbi:hypothetical protein BO78DRAFT_398953 [Aspergillus sclerotiicarbonarius CBS 121057]|uniref:Retrotransposon gag domain-containing protein n=1 Tax=Aspergillus sclerotiicarbonarius (strain CBS 121057 / IBT 28362) TaxID=1448318 RepID=A0A319E2V4_ASPSB|nr:hypothetical protein BO78DRAFT_398953 [Aspergillus sclerotiicarbonarius CBS 121057]